MNIWTSSGGTHLWAPTEIHPLAAWQAEIDRLMQLQTTILDPKKRKQVYDRVQELVAENDPVICLASPDVLVGVKATLGGFNPSVMRHYTLWNSEQLFWRKNEGEAAK